MKIMSKTSVILTSITTLALVMSVNTHAKIYKWTDANGQTHYTAQPPSQTEQRIKAKNIEDEIRANAGKYRPPAKTDIASASASTDSADDKAEEKLAGPDQKLIKYCDSQRNNIKQLKKNFRNVWIDVKGKKTSLNQEQRKEKVSMLESKIKEDCADVQASKKS